MSSELIAKVSVCLSLCVYVYVYVGVKDMWLANVPSSYDITKGLHSMLPRVYFSLCMCRCMCM